MKKIYKIFANLLMFSLIVASFSSCTEEVEYTPAEQLTGAQVFFPSNIKAKYELLQSEQSFSIEVWRINKADALTANISATVESNAFTIPSSVSFSAGSDATTLTIGYDPSKLDYDAFHNITLNIGDESITTPYGNSTVTFTAGIPAPWESLGMATFMDSWMFEYPYEVEIQHHMLEPNRYRLVDPYTEGLTEEGYIPNYNKGMQCDYLEFTIIPAGSTYRNVAITRNDLVGYNDFNTGYFYTTYSAEVLCLHPGRFTANTTEASFSYNRVLQFSASGEPEYVQLAPYYYMMGVGGWNYSQQDGVITILFPGVILADYSVEVTYEGHFANTSDEHYAVANVTLGPDAESAKVAIIKGQPSNAAVNGIIDGSIESTEIKASGEVRFEVTESGSYTILAITFADNEAKELDYATFDFAIGTADPVDIDSYVGNFILTGPSQFSGENPANMNVSIEKGTADNTLIIKGVTFAKEIKATYDPATTAIAIAPQYLADYVTSSATYDMTLYTTTVSGDVSTTIPLILNFNSAGSIVVSSSSQADGYLIRSEAAGGWVDGYYDIKLSRVSASPSFMSSFPEVKPILRNLKVRNLQEPVFKPALPVRHHGVFNKTVIERFSAPAF
jgi:hypothetical protein